MRLIGLDDREWTTKAWSMQVSSGGDHDGHVEVYLYRAGGLVCWLPESAFPVPDRVSKTLPTANVLSLSRYAIYHLHVDPDSRLPSYQAATHPIPKAFTTILESNRKQKCPTTSYPLHQSSTSVSTPSVQISRTWSKTSKTFPTSNKTTLAFVH